MPLRPTTKIRFVFQDRGRNEASTHLYVPISTPIDDVFSLADSAISRYNNVSDGLIVRVVAEVENYYTSLPSPEASSDVSRNLLIFYRNGAGQIESMNVISPRSIVFEDSGDYAGIRLNMDQPAVVQWQNMIENSGLQFLTKDGVIIGPNMLVGGLSI